jgi:glycosyltransferase involved in cell wall biosynthesis
MVSEFQKWAQRVDADDPVQLNVLLIVTNADLAGAPIHVRDLAISLKNHGHKVSVIFGEHGAIKDALDAEGIDTHVVQSMRSSINPQQDIRSFLGVKKIAELIAPDLIHAHSSKAGLIARLVGFILKVPVIYTIHGWGFGKGRRKLISSFVYFTEMVLSFFTDKFIAVSNADRHVGIRYLPIANSKISTIYNSTSFVPTPLYARQNPDGVRLIMVARNDHPKDYATFFKAVAKSNIDSVMVVGRGTDEDSFIASARSYTGDNFHKIEFLGARSDIEELLERANLFVLSSKFEGLPISIIEAMSKGLPILASSVGGIPELVLHGVNGYLFEPGNHEVLASYINELSLDKNKIRSFGAASFERYSAEFSAESMTRKVIDAYFSIVNKGKHEQY